MEICQRIGHIARIFWERPDVSRYSYSVALFPKLKVILVDDHPILRMGLRSVVDEHADFTVCGEATNAADALALVAELKPEIAVIDITLKSSSGLELTARLREQSPQLKVLIVSMYDAELYAERALKAGAMGYMMKREAPAKLIEALECLRAGDMYVSAKQKEKMLKRFLNQSPTPEREDNLSDREVELLTLFGNGFNTREVAERLGLNAEAVRGCREMLRQRLNLEKKSDVIRYAIEWTKRGDISVA